MRGSAGSSSKTWGGLKHQGSALERTRRRGGRRVRSRAGRGAPGIRMPGPQPGVQKKEYRKQRRRGHWQPALPGASGSDHPTQAAPRPLAGDPTQAAPRPAPPRLLADLGRRPRRGRGLPARPGSRVLPPGGGLMSAPAAPAARHRRPGREARPARLLGCVLPALGADAEHCRCSG